MCACHGLKQDHQPVCISDLPLPLLYMFRNHHHYFGVPPIWLSSRSHRVIARPPVCISQKWHQLTFPQHHSGLAQQNVPISALSICRSDIIRFPWQRKLKSNLSIEFWISTWRRRAFKYKRKARRLFNRAAMQKEKYDYKIVSAGTFKGKRPQTPRETFKMRLRRGKLYGREKFVAARRKPQR